MKSSNKKMNDRAKKYICIVAFSLLVVLFLGLVILTRDSKRIVEIKDFIKTDTKLLYINNDNKLSYPEELLIKYSIDYIKINSNELTIFERKSIQDIIDNEYLDNILIIYKNGSIVDILINYESNESVDEFLKNNHIIPEKIVDNVQEIVSESEKILDNEYSIIYIPYKKHDEIDKQNEILKSIADDYSIDYKRIDAFLLSENQQQKINKLLGLSDVENQILILVKDNKMIANIRGLHGKNTYVETLYELNFISELENRINEIDYDKFERELKNQDKSIILIGMDNSKDFDNVFDLLNEMIYNYEIEVSYIDLENKDSDIYKNVNEKLLEIGYTDAFSLPLVVIIESNKVLDYIIGNSNEEYFLDVFIENGVIKGDVINE